MGLNNSYIVVLLVIGRHLASMRIKIQPSKCLTLNLAVYVLLSRFLRIVVTCRGLAGQTHYTHVDLS